MHTGTAEAGDFTILSVMRIKESVLRRLIKEQLEHMFEAPDGLKQRAASVYAGLKSKGSEAERHRRQQGKFRIVDEFNKPVSFGVITHLVDDVFITELFMNEFGEKVKVKSFKENARTPEEAKKQHIGFLEKIGVRSKAGTGTKMNVEQLRQELGKIRRKIREIIPAGSSLIVSKSYGLNKVLRGTDEAPPSGFNELVDEYNNLIRAHADIAAKAAPSGGDADELASLKHA